jgi:hypothetical protein
MGKDVPPLQSVKLMYHPCSRLRAAWTPHIIIELEDEINRDPMICQWFALVVSLKCF